MPGNFVRAMLAAALAACAMAPAPARVNVTISGGRFVPAVVAISAGQSVTWANADDVDHRLEADDGSFASGNIRPGRSFEHRFMRAGRFGYFCVLHPREKGTIVVKE